MAADLHAAAPHHPPTGVHGVFCNRVRTFDGKNYVKHAKGLGHVLDRFDASQGGHTLLAAQ